MLAHYDVAVKRVSKGEGLGRSEYMDLFDMIGEERAIPITINRDENSAIGFINTKAEALLGDIYDLFFYIAKIMMDHPHMQDADGDENSFTFEGVNIWISFD